MAYKGFNELIKALVTKHNAAIDATSMVTIFLPIFSFVAKRNFDHQYFKKDIFILGELPKKKTGFFWEISPKSVYPPTHPRVFVRFGRRKGEIWVEKGDFRGNLGGF